MNKIDLSLYLVTDRELSRGRSVEEITEQAVKGGATVIQLREKDTPTLEFYNTACSLKRLLKPYGIPLIINDRLDIALAADADGIHIGQSDLPYETVRRILGKDKIIGLSVETMQQAKDANLLDVDYIGISPVFSTNTKKDIKQPFELEGIRKIASFTNHPTVAIGGINKNNTADIIKSGADGIAVVSAIVSADNPKDAARELRDIVDNAKHKNI